MIFEGDIRPAFSEFIFITAVKWFYNAYKDMWISQYTKINIFLTSCIEEGGSLVKFFSRPVALDVLLGIIDATEHLHRHDGGAHYVPVTDDLYLLTGLEYPNQSGHKYFDVQEGRSAVFFVLAPALKK